MNTNLENPPWHSSYEKNNYGDFFYSIVRVYKPEKVVELGTMAGFSAYHMARGLKANKKGSIDCHDLWEKYGSNSVPKSVALENLEEFSDIVSLKQSDAVDADREYEMIDILHVDLDNEGGILEKIIPRWIEKTRQIILIEGGSGERDTAKWNAKIPIKKWLQDFSRQSGVEYFTVEPFPSLTIIRKV